MAWKPASISWKWSGADGDHERQADGGVERVAAADPVPEAEHVVRVDAERLDLLGVGRHRHEVLGHGRLVAAQAGQRPFAGRAGVGHRLQRGERLRRDDEQRLGGVEVARLLGEVGAVDVRDEPEGERAVAVELQRLVRHLGPEVRTADADVDDVADRLAGVAQPRARSGCGRENAAMRSSTACTSGTTSWPSTYDAARPRGARSATCSTARSSVTLMCSPRNIASMRSRSPHSSASATRSRSVSSVTRFFE